MINIVGIKMNHKPYRQPPNMVQYTSHETEDVLECSLTTFGIKLITLKSPNDLLKSLLTNDST